MENTLPREHDAPATPMVSPGLCFTYSGHRYEVEQILPGNRAICHSYFDERKTTILSFAAIVSGK